MTELCRTDFNLKDVINDSTLHFLGVRVDNVSKETAVNAVTRFLFFRDNAGAKKIFFTNVHTICLARKNNRFKQIVNNADLALPDGSGLKIAGKVFSNPLKENLNGTDFTPLILKIAENNNMSVYFLGGKEDVIKACVCEVKKRFPCVRITGCHSGFFKQAEVPNLIKNINDSKTDILFVGMGSPLQETFINDHSKELNTAVCFAVGGLFDFLSGNKKRAPKIIRKSGMEWLFRFFEDPKTKWERIFIEIPFFLLLIFKTRLIPDKPRLMAQ